MNADYTSNDIGQAWHTFINKGHIGDYTIRPEILRSWERSRGVDFLLRQPQKLSDSIFQKKHLQNDELIAAARPLMQYLYTFSNKNYMLLCDKDGYVIEKNYPFEYPYTMGCNCSDDHIGTNAIGIALSDNIAYRLEGFENYAIRYHTYSEAAVPIHNRDGIIIGVICILNPFVKIDDNALRFAELTQEIIEKQLNNKLQIEIENEIAFMEMIDSLDECMIIVDNDGCILRANKMLLNTLDINNTNKLIGKSLGNYVTDKKFVTNILSSRVDSSQVDFTMKISGELLTCSALNHSNIISTSESRHKALLFTADKVNKVTYTTNIPAAFNNRKLYCDNLIGESPEWQKIKNIIKKVAKVQSTTVLIEGESGTGKELVARAIHNESGREGQFIAINCGSIPKELLQSELYGHEEGSFTGAKRGGSTGKIELANGGTLFLDEIGEMPMDMQVSLLRVLEEKRVTRLGAGKSVNVDINVVAATNRNLKDAVRDREFREDLYYRLNVINIKLPPLRERRDDILLISHSLIEQMSNKLNMQKTSITDEAIDILKRYDWPGNVRELRNIIEQSLILSQDNCINADILPDYLSDDSNGRNFSYDNLTIELSDSDMILTTLKKNNGNISQTARELGMARNTLYKRVKKLDLFIARNSD